MLSWSYKVGFLGTILLWEICLNRTGAGVNATPALNRQGGNVLVAAPYSVEFIFQNEYGSYKCRSGRASVRSHRSAGRGFFQLQKQTCQKIWTLRALVFEARLFLPSFSSKVSVLVQSACGGQADFIYSFIHREAPLRQLSKAADD